MTDKEAQRLIRTIRGAALLTGFRGSEPVDLDALARWSGRLSQLLIEHPEIQEVDLNPIIVNPRGRPAGVVDARIRVELPGD